MQINVQWNTVELIRRLNKGERRLAFAAVNAINGAAKDVQAAEREAVQQKFTIRRDFVVKQAAIIRPFASVGKGRPFAEVSIGQRPRMLLGKFEAGGVKEHAGRNVAIPVTGAEARPSFATPQEFPPLVKKLKFRKPRKRSPGKRVVLQGTTGEYYLIPGVGIFRRTGESSHLVIAYKPEVKIPPTLGWLARAKRVADVSLRERMEREAINAIGRGS